MQAKHLKKELKITMSQVHVQLFKIGISLLELLEITISQVQLLKIRISLLVILEITISQLQLLKIRISLLKLL